MLPLWSEAHCPACRSGIDGPSIELTGIDQGTCYDGFVKDTGHVWRQGLAAGLLCYTAARARDAGFSASILTVASDNEAALRAYARQGYEHVSCLFVYRKELP